MCKMWKSRKRTIEFTHSLTSQWKWWITFWCLPLIHTEYTILNPVFFFLLTFYGEFFSRSLKVFNHIFKAGMVFCGMDKTRLFNKENILLLLDIEVTSRLSLFWIMMLLKSLYRKCYLNFFLLRIHSFKRNYC